MQAQTSNTKYLIKFQIKKVNFNMIKTNNSSFFKSWSGVAAIVLLVMSFGLNVFLFNKLNMANNDIAHLYEVNHKHVYQNYISKANYRNTIEQLSLLHKHGSKTTHLESLQENKEYSAMAYWNSETKEVYVSIDSLPQPDLGKQYQMWAMVKGKMISTGLISPLKGTKTLLRMKNVKDATAFAISLEKLGGTQIPTSSAIYVLGTI